MSLTLAGGKNASEPLTTATALTPHNIDERENPGGDLVLPWSATEPSWWQAQSGDARGEVTMDFVKVDRDKAAQGIYQFTLRLPVGASGDPRALAAEGSAIDLNVRLRGYQFGVASGNLFPLIYLGLPADEASARAAYAVIHELAHALGFAPKQGEFFYSVGGPHCAHGMKSHAEACVRDNKGTVGKTLAATLARGVTGKDVPAELAALGKFGTCVMWGHTHRDKTTEVLFGAALQFCDACAPLMRVTPIGAAIGGDA